MAKEKKFKNTAPTFYSRNLPCHRKVLVLTVPYTFHRTDYSQDELA